MRLEEITSPVGPEPVGVYWRRRAIAAVVILLLLFLASRCGSGSGKKKTSSTNNGIVATTPSKKPSTSASPAAPATNTTGACQSSDITVSADANAGDYPAGTDPKIVITVKNVSGHPCTLDTSKRFLTISSGGDLWWSSAVCAPTSQPPVDLASGQALTSSYTWNRKRQATSCALGGEAPSGTYLAQAHVDTIVTPGAVLRLH